MKNILIETSTRIVRVVEDQIVADGPKNFLVTRDDQTEYAFLSNPNEHIVDTVSASEVPSDFFPGKYFYTEQGEFEVNPNFVEQVVDIPTDEEELGEFDPAGGPVFNEASVFYQSAEDISKNTAIRLRILNDGGDLKTVAHPARSLTSANEIDFTIGSTTSNYSRIQLHKADENRAIMSFVNSSHGSIDLVMLTFDENSSSGSNIQLGPITNTWLTPADNDATPNAVAFEFVSENEFAIAGRDNIRMGSFNESGATITMNNWWGFDGNALSINSISPNRFTAISRRTNKEYTVAEVFEHSGANITASFGSERIKSGSKGRGFSNHSNVVFEDDAFLSTFANPNESDYGNYIAGFLDDDEYDDFTDETVFVSQNMSNSPFRFSTAVLTSDPNIALVLYTKIVSGRRRAFYRLIEVDAIEEETYVSSEVTLLDDPRGDVEKVQIERFEGSTYGVSYVLNLSNGGYEGNFILLNMEGITSITGNITGNASSPFTFYENTDDVDALSLSSGGSGQVFISVERQSGSPLLIVSSNTVTERRALAVGIAAENTEAGDFGEVYVASQIAHDVQDGNGDNLLASRTYYINADGTIGVEDTGYPIGIALDFNKMVIIPTNR